MSHRFSRISIARGVQRAIVAAVLVTLTVATPEARINGPRITSFDYGCGLLQDELDGLVKEYWNATDARREEIITRVRQIGATWNEVGCRAAYGDIAIFPQAIAPLAPNPGMIAPPTRLPVLPLLPAATHPGVIAPH